MEVQNDRPRSNSAGWAITAVALLGFVAMFGVLRLYRHTPKAGPRAKFGARFWTPRAPRFRASRLLFTTNSRA